MQYTVYVVVVIRTCTFPRGCIVLCTEEVELWQQLNRPLQIVLHFTRAKDPEAKLMPRHNVNILS